MNTTGSSACALAFSSRRRAGERSAIELARSRVGGFEFVDAAGGHQRQIQVTVLHGVRADVAPLPRGGGPCGVDARAASSRTVVRLSSRDNPGIEEV
jgi:hypothetical protein